MTEYGMLIDYEWCTGCHSCETACQMEHHLPVGQFGIKLNEIGPFEYALDRWQLSSVPVPTDLCDFCTERQAKGKRPTCQHHCQAQCLEVGPIDELAKKIASKKKLVLFNN